MPIAAARLVRHLIPPFPFPESPESSTPAAVRTDWYSAWAACARMEGEI
jgi:hypothetical protein